MPLTHILRKILAFPHNPKSCRIVYPLSRRTGTPANFLHLARNALHLFQQEGSMVAIVIVILLIAASRFVA
jgi:hypothetical protein